jgi:DNA repair protein RadD
MVIEQPTLYPHQEDMVARLRKSMAVHRAVILQAPPGTGKTRIAKWMFGAAANRQPLPTQTGKSLFAVHRRGLVDNASNSFNESPQLPHGVLMSGATHDASQAVQVASIDTLLSWFCEGGAYSWDVTFDLIVFDEAHSHHSKLQTFLSAHNRRRLELGLSLPYVIGPTATPQAQGLADLYQEIVRGPETQWLIDHKFLKEYRYFRATQGRLGLLVKKGDEYTKDSVCIAMDGLSGDLVRDWKKFAEGRATIGFFPRRTHAQEAQEALSSAGVKAEYVDGETDDDRRRRLYRWLNEGVIEYLCNVGVVERGTDIARVGCVQMCTAVGNIVRWFQMIGRGSRPHPEVPDCLVLDHGGNLKHGFFEDSIPWTLDWSHRPSKDHVARPRIECPRCQAVYRGGKCRNCGYEPSSAERKSQGLAFDGAELQEVTRKEREKKPKPQTCEQIMVSALYSAGRTNKTWKQALGMAYSKAEKQGTRFRVPKRFEVGGRVYNAVPYGSTDSSRRVKDLYDFV